MLIFKRKEKTILLKVGDRVEVIADSLPSHLSAIGTITAARHPSLTKKFVVRFGDGSEATLPARQLQIPPAITGSLIFDTAVSPLPKGFRGKAGNRHLRFVAREFDILVRLAENERRHRILGTLTCGDSAVQSALVTLLVEGEARETETTDESGEFCFADVHEDRILLEILVPRRRILLALAVF